MCKLWPMKTHTIIMMFTLVVAGLVIGCSSEPAAPTTTPVPVVPQIVPVSQFLAQPNPKDCSYCYLADADLIGANLSWADLSVADLSAAYLSEANLWRVNLTGADLTDADLTDADLTGAGLKGANLTDAILDGVIGADFSDVLNVPAKCLKD